MTENAIPAWMRSSGGVSLGPVSERQQTVQEIIDTGRYPVDHDPIMQLVGRIAQGKA